MGIEPTLAAWEAAVLPLNYTRTEWAPMGEVRISGAGNGTSPAELGQSPSFEPPDTSESACQTCRTAGPPREAPGRRDDVMVQPKSKLQ
jgi:hypothetical protein